VLRAYGITDKGHVRTTNEDCFAIDDDLSLCVVADGMGGHNAGEVAARMAVDAVRDFVAGRCDLAGEWPFGYDAAASRAGNLLRTAIHVANLQILEAAFATDEYAGMGTTIVAALVEEGTLTVAHVGDSRLYVARDGRLRQVTSDDSWMASALRHNPALDPGVLQHHPMRHALTNVVGARPATDVHVVEEPLAGGERLILSTDGVHGVLEKRHFEHLLARHAGAEALAAQLIDAALARGSRDNCTVVVADVDQPTNL
jgi:protein phosphatase